MTDREPRDEPVSWPQRFSTWLGMGERRNDRILAIIGVIIVVLVLAIAIGFNLIQSGGG